MTWEKSQFAAVTLNGLIYAIGGKNNSQNSVNTTEIYNPATNSWVISASLLEARCNFAAVVLNGLIYVIGGYDWGRAILQSVEIFDGNKWSSGPELNWARQTLAAAVGGDGYIYATGGGFNNMEVFNGKTWELSDVLLPAPLSFHVSTGSPDGKSIYVIGGYNGTAYTNLGYRFLIQSQKWELIAPMKDVRWAAGGILARSGLIYMLGGSDGNVNCWNSIEVYNSTLNQWDSMNLPTLLNPVYLHVSSIDNEDNVYALGGVPCGLPYGQAENYVEAWDQQRGSSC